MQLGFSGSPQDFANRDDTSDFFHKKFPNTSIIQPKQVHGNTVVQITSNNIHEVFEADGVWTTEGDILLSVKTADCLGILLYHPEQQIIAAVHAGWRGLAQKISTQFLQNFSFAVRKDFQVFLSHSLGPCCAQFSNPYTETPEFFHSYVTEISGKYFVDLWNIAVQELKEMGVVEENIFMPKECTKCSDGKWWSHRNGNTERNLSWIML